MLGWRRNKRNWRNDGARKAQAIQVGETLNGERIYSKEVPLESGSKIGSATIACLVFPHCWDQSTSHPANDQESNFIEVATSSVARDCSTLSSRSLLKLGPNSLVRFLSSFLEFAYVCCSRPVRCTAQYHFACTGTRCSRSRSTSYGRVQVLAVLRPTRALICFRTK